MPPTQLQFDQLAVIGVGLIGGSIALAARERSLTRRVVGVGRNPQRLAEAVQRGVIDEFVTDAANLEEIDLAIVCTPVDRIGSDVQAVLNATPAGTLVTDAGSTKGAICRTVECLGSSSRFVGSHPLAGSHQTGFEHADPQLFEGGCCVVTPTGKSDPRATAQVRAFWEVLGMQVRQMSPERHDQILAVTSHIPHMAAAAVASLLDRESVEFASTGFRDTTRVAAGDPELWTAIFATNAGQLTLAADRLIAQLQQYREAVARQDSEQLQKLLSQAQNRRTLFDQRHSGGEGPE